MQSVHNFENYGFALKDLISTQRSTPSVHMGDQGLSPPYSNQSPPHSVQSNIALSPQEYIGKCNLELMFYLYVARHMCICVPQLSEKKTSTISKLRQAENLTIFSKYPWLIYWNS